MNRRRILVVVALLAGCGSTKGQNPDSSDETSDARDASATDALEATDATSETPAGDADTHDSADAREAGDATDGGVDAKEDTADGASAALSLPAACATDTAVPPNSLVCTGLYANIATKEIAPGNAAYAPAVPLWADNATKQRWIYLPPGSKIDNTNPNEWMFPVGTKVWKEFSRDGVRVETRLWQKVDAGYWVDTTYAWSADESSATRSDGGDIPWGDGGTYHIPTPDECQQCHRGRTDRILGFEQGLLGLSGATGLTLEQLVANGQLTTPLATPTPLVIGDDGTGLAAPALAWLHVNCGTTCHNNNSSSTAWATGLFMRLDATQLDGRSVKGFDTLTTTIGVAAISPAWIGRTRIIPHDPGHSLLYQLISHRGTGNQMPPIATSVVDEANIPLVEAWIEELSPLATDGGTGDGAASTDAGSDGHGSTPKNDGGVDGREGEAGEGDAGEPEADAAEDAPVDAPQDLPVDAITSD